MSLGLSRLSFYVFSRKPSAPNDRVRPIGASRDGNIASSVEKIRLKELSSSKHFAYICAANCDISCLSRAVSFWATCNLYGFRRRPFQRTLWVVACGICNSALAQEIDFFGLRMKACLTQSTSSSGLLDRPVYCIFSTLSVGLNCSYIS
jgi:hypothetical protein